MAKLEFNHNEPGRPNGNYFALPYSQGEAEIEIISVPWDVTASYKPGAAQGPEAIIEASVQVDLYDKDVPEAWNISVSNTELDILTLNRQNRRFAEKVIRYIESGYCTYDEAVTESIDQVNRASEIVNEMIRNAASAIIGRGKIPAVVGGDHSSSFGIIKAVASKNPGTGILHIDAHADLRKAYEGFKYSHASVMYNVINEIDGIDKLVQVGIRDLCEDESNLIAASDKIVAYHDDTLKEGLFNGKTWDRQCDEIIGHLPSNVYISFDIDGLNPELCPNTGTPVPGGLDFSQASYLLRKIMRSGRKIVGFDLNEVAPGNDNDWDANVGARLLFKLCCYAYRSQKNRGE